MTWLAALVALALVVVIADRAVWLASRRLDRLRAHQHELRRERGAATIGTGSPGTALGPLFDLYQPGHRHVVEEQDRQRLEADQAESGAPPLGIDLDAGTASFAVRRGRRESGPVRDDDAQATS